jgi:hypothetical protein
LATSARAAHPVPAPASPAPHAPRPPLQAPPHPPSQINPYPTPPPKVFITGHGGNEFMKFQDQQELMAADVADALAQVRACGGGEFDSPRFQPSHWGGQRRTV